VGGLYQQVAVTPGINYYANIVWLVFDSLANDAAVNQNVGGIGRRIGIDPFGGTDSRSPNVVWSEDNWRNDCKICNVEHVTVTAQAETITVFLRIEDTWRLKAAEKGFAIPPSKDQFWIDDIGMKPVGGEPVAVPQAQSPVETPTPVPPTAVPPTDTPVPPPEETATFTPEPEEPEETATPTPEAASPTPEPAPTDTVAPQPPTLTPTSTPPPTATLVPRPTRTPTRPRSLSPPSSGGGTSGDTTFLLGAAGTTICVGGLALAAMGIVFAGLFWLYRLGWGQQKK
jgi:hypothetical protein